MKTIAAAGVTAITLYLVGVMGQRLFGFPAPVAMLFLAVVAQAHARGLAAICSAGAFGVYKFFSTGVTYPLLFAIGVALTPVGRADGRVHAAQHHHHRRTVADADGHRLRRRPAA